jgi:hypothetical protein
MKFVTDLSKEQIAARLNTYTMPCTFSNFFTGNIFISKFKNNEIRIWKTAKFGNGRGGQLPLTLKLTQEDKQIILKGGFRLPNITIVILILFVSIPWFSIAIPYLMDARLDFWGKLIICLPISIWSVFCFVLFPLFNLMFYEKQQREVLEFLRVHLEVKRVK